MVQMLASPPPCPAPPRIPSSPLEARVRQSLHDSPYRQLQNVRCHCSDGAVRLIGTLPSFFMKQMAQETVRRIAGVNQIENQVHVV